jgi:DNA-directed RNA polymerase specialized sigma24 family protein
MTQFKDANELLNLFRVGDPAAYAAIKGKFYSQLVESSNRIIDDEIQAGEIASETLANLFRRSHTYVSTGEYESSLIATTRIASIDYLRYLKAFIDNYNEYAERKLDPLNNKLEVTTLEDLFRSLQRLPDRSRHLFNYLYVQKVSIQKAAELMETTVENLENLRIYTLEKFKQDLAESYSPLVLGAFLAFLE